MDINSVIILNLCIWLRFLPSALGHFGFDRAIYYTRTANTNAAKEEAQRLAFGPGKGEHGDALFYNQSPLIKVQWSDETDQPRVQIDNSHAKIGCIFNPAPHLYKDSDTPEYEYQKFSNLTDTFTPTDESILFFVLEGTEARVKDKDCGDIAELLATKQSAPYDEIQSHLKRRSWSGALMVYLGPSPGTKPQLILFKPQEQQPNPYERQNKASPDNPQQ